MPRRNGLDLARQLRDDGFRGPIVVLSGAIKEEPFRAALEEGAIQRVLTRPWTISGLLKELLALVRARAPSAA